MRDCFKCTSEVTSQSRDPILFAWSPESSWRVTDFLLETTAAVFIKLIGSWSCHSRQSKWPFVMIWSRKRIAQNLCRNSRPRLSWAEMPRKSLFLPGENPWPSYSPDLNPFVFSGGAKWRRFFVRSIVPLMIWRRPLKSWPANCQERLFAASWWISVAVGRIAWRLAARLSNILLLK